MRKTEIITVGSEILSGKVLDTTSLFLCRKLLGIGINVTNKATVLDKTSEIVKAVKQAWKRSSIIIVTGGLGPTRDDITKKAVAKAFNLNMTRSVRIEASIRLFYKKLRKEMPSLCLNQALLPETSEPLENSWGTAPGVLLKKQNKLLFMLPGVPHETTNMFTYRVLPIISKELGINKPYSCEINIFGIGESIIQEKLDKLNFSGEITISYLPDHGSVKLALSGNINKKQFQPYIQKILRIFKSNVYSRGETTLEAALGKTLNKKKYHLAVAESCTGGLLAGQIVNNSGASAYFAGGVIAYSNKIKTDLLGVNPALLKKYGAVSVQTAKAMATGMAKKFSCRCGIGITGVAGPLGGTKKKPVGRLSIASCCGKKILAESFQFYGDRSFIRHQAVNTALFQMLTLLKQN